MVAQASGEEPSFPMHCKASLIAPCKLFLPAKPPLPAGSVLFCSASLLPKTLPAQPQNGLLSSSHPPALDLPAREAGQPTLAGSCLTALSCGLPGCRSLPPCRCCVHPAHTADSPGPCLHPLRPRRQELGLFAAAPALRRWHLGRERWECSETCGMDSLSGLLCRVTPPGPACLWLPGPGVLGDPFCHPVEEERIEEAVLSISSCFFPIDTKGAAAQQFLGLHVQPQLLRGKTN